MSPKNSVLGLLRKKLASTFFFFGYMSNWHYKYGTKSESRTVFKLGFGIDIIRSLEINSCRNFFFILPFCEVTKIFEKTSEVVKKSYPFLILRDNRFAKSD